MVNKGAILNFSAIWRLER